MKRTLVLLCVLSSASAFAQLVRAPYLQRTTPTAITVVWRTLQSEESVVKYGASPTTLTNTMTAATGTDHFVRITGLQPDTLYYYSVGTMTTVRAPASSAEAAEYQFRTHPTPGTVRPVRFWVVGDDGDGDLTQATVVSSMKTFVGQAGQRWPDLFLHMGDMAYNAGTDLEFTTQHFAPHSTVLRRVPLWPTIGNHEGSTSNGATQTGPYFQGYELPTAGESGGVASGTEAYYSFDYANVHFIVLDSYDLSRSANGTMATWLKSDLMASTREWTVVYFHHPPYTAGTHTDTETELQEMRQNILPILERAGVDLVLSGHSHIYERSYLVNGAYYGSTVDVAGKILDMGGGREDAGTGAYRKPAARTPDAGTIYVVAGHGSASLGGPANHPIMFFSEKQYGSVLFDISGSQLRGMNLRMDGVVTDRFTLLRGTGGAAGGSGTAGGTGATAGGTGGTAGGTGATAGGTGGTAGGLATAGGTGATAGGTGATAGGSGGTAGGTSATAGGTGGTAGGSGSAAGGSGATAGGSSGGEEMTTPGCGCATVDPAGLFLVVVLMLRRRRRAQPSGL